MQFLRQRQHYTEIKKLDAVICRLNTCTTASDTLIQLVADGQLVTEEQ